jgi:hypothetical protein
MHSICADSSVTELVMKGSIFYCWTREAASHEEGNLGFRQGYESSRHWVAMKIPLVTEGCAVDLPKAAVQLHVCVS